MQIYNDLFSTLDAHTASRLFEEYIMDALLGKTVLHVTHQVDFLPAFDLVLLMSEGKIVQLAQYHQLLAQSEEFQVLENAHKETAGSESLAEVGSWKKSSKPAKEIREVRPEIPLTEPAGDQLIKTEEREAGDATIRPYTLYISTSTSRLHVSLNKLSQLIKYHKMSGWQLIFRVPMQVNCDLLRKNIYSGFFRLSLVDLDVPFSFSLSAGSTINTCQSGIIGYHNLAGVDYFNANGLLNTSLTGSATTRALKKEDRFSAQNLELIDRNASLFFHNFSANEYLIHRLEIMSAIVISSSTLVMVLHPSRVFGSGFVGMTFSYCLSLNTSLVNSTHKHCTLGTYIISVERINQYMHNFSATPLIVDEN